VINWDNVVIEQHPNRFVRFYGNFMAKIGAWFLKRSISYGDTYALSLMEEDFTGIPTMACLCGCRIFRLNVMWDEETRSVGWYELRQECLQCGTITTAPTPVDEGMDCV